MSRPSTVKPIIVAPGPHSGNHDSPARPMVVGGSVRRGGGAQDSPGTKKFNEAALERMRREGDAGATRFDFAPEGEITRVAPAIMDDESNYRDLMTQAAAEFLRGREKSDRTVGKKLARLRTDINRGLSGVVSEEGLVQAIRNLDFCCDLVKGVDVSVLRLNLTDGRVEAGRIEDAAVFAPAENSKTILVRDDRNKVAVHKSAGQDEAWKMQFLNMYLTAFDVVRSNITTPTRQGAIIENIQSIIAARFTAFSEAIAGKNSKESLKALKEEQKLLVGFLRDKGIKNSGKKLDFAKDWQGFRFDNCDALISASSLDAARKVEARSSGRSGRYNPSEEEKKSAEGRKPILLQSEFACKGFLTVVQRAEIERCAPPLGRRPAVGPKWFRDLAPDQQRIVASKRDILLEGRHVIPTQLTNIPGLRNSYVKRVSVLDMPEETKVDTVATEEETKRGVVEEVRPVLVTVEENFHSGAVAALAKDKAESARLTEHNIAQFRALQGRLFPAAIVSRGIETGAPATRNTRRVVTVVNSLNSGRSFNKNDVKIIERSRAACATADDVEFLPTPFNGFRRFIGKEYDALNGILGEVAEAISNAHGRSENMTKISNYIRTGKGFKTAKAAFETIRDSAVEIREDDLKIIDIAMKLRSTMSENRFFDSGNSRLRTSALTTILAHEINDCHSNATSCFRGLPYIHVARSCKSGKDRTALAEAYTTALALHEKYDLDLEYAMSVVVGSGHYQVIPGSAAITGGTIGCRGTKGENRAGFPKALSAVCEPLIEATSKGNKIKVKDKEGEKGLEIHVAPTADARDRARLQELDSYRGMATPPRTGPTQALRDTQAADRGNRKTPGTLVKVRKNPAMGLVAGSDGKGAGSR